MKEELINAVMEACHSESGVTFERSENMADSPHLFWPTLLALAVNRRLYHGDLEFRLYDFYDNADKEETTEITIKAEAHERLSVDHVVMDQERVSIEGHYDGEEFWFNILFHPPEHAKALGTVYPDGRIAFDDGREGRCEEEDDDDEDEDDEEEKVDPALVCDFPYFQIMKDPPLSLRCKKRKGHSGEHGQVV